MIRGRLLRSWPSGAVGAMGKADSISYPPRGLSRDEAARYIGVGATKFDELVKDGLMPKPKRVGSRVVWDRVALDIAFTDLPGVDSGNFFDRLYAVK